MKAINPDKLDIIWTSRDIIDHAQEGMDITLSVDDARSVLRFLEHRHDANYGINWDVITYAIHTHISKTTPLPEGKGVEHNNEHE
ncbi:MAG: hypothetical protein CMJ25_20990 [Phycisphaerae bacterium]|nr:hypothetical protein [Phycisphaerae bacterium]|tara:strand:+ start:21830 stop:22084 length:255 start_codon:yes stop_codon:yes gene_type:complete